MISTTSCRLVSSVHSGVKLPGVYFSRRRDAESRATPTSSRIKADNPGGQKVSTLTTQQKTDVHLEGRGAVEVDVQAGPAPISFAVLDVRCGPTRDETEEKRREAKMVRNNKKTMTMKTTGWQKFS